MKNRVAMWAAEKLLPLSNSTFVRSYSTSTPPSWTKLLPPHGLLTRDFIHTALYDPRFGYFASAGPRVVGRMTRPLPFPKLWHSWDYRRHLRRLYDSLRVAWLTPSELFQPYYAQVLCEYMIFQHARSIGPNQPMVIYEIGAGQGTVALSLLNYLRDKYPNVYANTQYKIIEISRKLATQQVLRVRHGGQHDAPDRFQVLVRDATDPATWGAEQNQAPCFVLGCEVLDNMPHDRLVLDDQGGKESWVTLTTGGDVKEELRPLSDPLLQATAEALDLTTHTHVAIRGAADCAAVASTPPLPKDTMIHYVPTRCHSFLRALHRARPNHHLILADFDHLPDVRLPGQLAPLVSETVNGLARDYDSYLIPAPGTVDIFFPTDFNHLTKLYTTAATASSSPSPPYASHIASTQFLRDWATPAIRAATSTRLGFRPMERDFENTRFFLGGTI